MTVFLILMWNRSLALTEQVRTFRHHILLTLPILQLFMETQKELISPEIIGHFNSTNVLSYKKTITRMLCGCLLLFFLPWLFTIAIEVHSLFLLYICAALLYFVSALIVSSLFSSLLITYFVNLSIYFAVDDPSNTVLLTLLFAYLVICVS